MARWHTQLRIFETGAGQDPSGSEWSQRAEFDDDLVRVQTELVKYVDVLADLAGVSR